MNISELINDSFPNLEFCDTVTANNIKSKSSKLPQIDAAQPWFKWLASGQNSCDWLRIKLVDDHQLFIKKIDNEEFILVLNKEENNALLLNFINKFSGNSTTQKTIPASKSQEPSAQQDHSAEDLSLKMQDAVRIQRMIMPRDEDVSKSFSSFFAVHQQQDVVGGDFYWLKQMKACTLIGVIDCTGHSVEGAMTSMVCNSLLNQASASIDLNNLKCFVEEFYTMLGKYNDTAEDMLDYGIDAEIGIFCFNHVEKEIKFLTSGIATFIKKTDGIELLRPRKLRDPNDNSHNVQEFTFPMSEVENLYVFSDGVTDLYDSSDKNKLGYKGLRQIIEHESAFGKQYYFDEINKWKGENIQYDDITLLGLAI